MDSPELKNRCKQFALRIINLVRALPNDRVATPIANQIIRSGTSTAANYRAACIAKSRADFVSKLGTTVEEADETALWLELIVDGKLLPADKVTPLLTKANELVAIFLSSIQTARRNAEG